MSNPILKKTSRTHGPALPDNSKGGNPVPSTSKTPQVTGNQPSMSTVPVAVDPPSGQPPSSKKKKPTRTERQARREDAVLKALYAPKESRITLISPAIMKLMNKNSQESLKVNSVTYPQLAGGGKSDTATPSDTPSSFYQDFPEVSSVYADAAAMKRDKAVQTVEVKVGPAFVEGPCPPLSTVRKSKNTHTPSKAPIVINLEQLLSCPRTKLGKRDKKKAGGPSRTVPDKKVRPVGNILDSTGLTFLHRGKMRDKPRKKRPTTLKKAIITSRSLRKVTIGRHFEVTGDSDIVRPTMSHSGDLPGCPVEGSPESPTVINKEAPEVEKDASSGSSSIPMESDNIFKKLLEEALLPKKQEPRKEILETPTAVGLSPELRSKAKLSLHPKPKKFRPYCDMYTSKELHGHVIEFVKELHRFQDRLYHSDPIKFKTHKRFVIGLREVTAQLVRDKIQLIILAPDIEPNEVKGGLDDKIEELLSTARAKGTPYTFSGNRFILGKPMKVKGQVSIIGILNKQGAEELMEKVMAETVKLRESYDRDFNSIVAEMMRSRIES